MRIGNGYIYKILSPFNNERIFDKILSEMEKTGVEFRNIWFEIIDYKLSSKSKKLINKEGMEKYRINTEYDYDKDNEIIFSNYNNNGSIEKREVEKLVRELLGEIKKSMFWEIILAVDWSNKKNIDYNTVNECIDYIKISNEYEGILLELCFEKGQENRTRFVLEKIKNAACLKMSEKKNIILFTSTEELQYGKIEQKVKTLFSKFDRHYNQDFELDFELSEEETMNKVNFSQMLKKIISHTDYCYDGYKAGYYEIYRYDKYNSCIKILFTYDWSCSKVLGATIRFCIPYFKNSCGGVMPHITGKLCRENIAAYIKFCIKVAYEMSSIYENLICQNKEYKILDIDMKNITDIRSI